MYKRDERRKHRFTKLQQIEGSYKYINGVLFTLSAMFRVICIFFVI